ncbi:MAG: alpha/beta hydrolase, partial [Planctomycetes bacterium]|nr:alpha/beta hydrolase [Planctomycetota bacterium]
WVHAHVAEHGGDPHRIFISGQSAGGHLVALLALDGKHLKALGLSPDHIKGVLAVSGVYNLAESIKGMDEFLLEPAFGEDASKWPEAAPVTYVTGKHPPFLITYADRDPLILHRQAKMLHDALKAKGADTQLELIRGRNHINEVLNIGQPDDPLTAVMLRFMKEKMR